MSYTGNVNWTYATLDLTAIASGGISKLIANLPAEVKESIELGKGAWDVLSGTVSFFGGLFGCASALSLVAWCIWWNRTYPKRGEDIREARNRYREEYEESRSPAARAAQRRSNKYALFISGSMIAALLFAAATKPRWEGRAHLSGAVVVTALLMLSACACCVLYVVQVVRVAAGWTPTERYRFLQPALMPRCSRYVDRLQRHGQDRELFLANTRRYIGGYGR
jgi:hypothetical protein